MTTETNSPQEPNEFGFAGDPTGPQPKPDAASRDRAQGEEIAVPAGDLTGAAADAMEERTDRDRGA